MTGDTRVDDDAIVDEPIDNDVPDDSGKNTVVVMDNENTDEIAPGNDNG